MWLDIPANIQNAQIDEKSLKGFSPTEDVVAYDKDLKQKVAEIVKRLKVARRPFIHVGQGVRIAGAVGDFLRLIERYSLPFATARNANDMIPSDHELYIGRPGTFPQRGPNFALQTSDFYLAIGTRLALAQTGYNTKDFARNAWRAMVDIDHAELHKSTLHLEMRVHSDARAFLKELERQLEGASIDVSPWIKQIHEWNERYPVVRPEYRKQKGSVNSYYFLEVLSKLLGSGDCIVTDMGFAFQNTHQVVQVKKGQRMFTNSGYASMGWGLPAAVGACFAIGRKRTICIAGEGGLMMTIQELATIMHYKLPVKLFIFNNGGYLTIKQTQEMGFGGRVMGADHDSGLSFPDFLKLAEAHGIPAVRLASHDRLEENVRAVLDAPGPQICEIMMDQNQDQAPKAVNRRLADGRMQQTALEDLYPFLDPKEIEANMSISKKE